MDVREYLEVKYGFPVFANKYKLGADNTTITHWDETLGIQPTLEEITSDMPAMLVVKTKRENVKELAATDAGMIRVIEDVWRVLKDKNLVVDTDLPAFSVEKLTKRKALRNAIK